MGPVRARHVFRMERVIAQLRVGAVVFSLGVLSLENVQYASAHMAMSMTIGVVFMYAVAVAITEPYRYMPPMSWGIMSGCIDWGLITGLILATGGVRSPFDLLYFFLILSMAMRYGLREVLIGGIGTAVGYFLVSVLTVERGSAGLPEAGITAGYLMLFSLGSGILAREANQHLRARADEEARRRALQELTTTIGHDLASPLAAITGLVEVLSESAAAVLSPEQQRLLHRINANVQEGSNLIANLRDAEVIEHGRQPFRPGSVDVNVAVRRAVETQASQAEGKHIGMALDLDHHLPPVVVDGHLIQRLVTNLLNNAIKFTPREGTVRIATALRHSHVVIDVWDNGPDVPASLRSILFDKYVRDESSPGMGLGLYICKAIVDLHRGRIFTRKVGEGVSFVVELPLIPSEDADVRSQQAPGAQGDRCYPWQSPVRLRTAGSA